MKKLTRKERLKALENGFYRCGYVTREDIENYVLDSLHLQDQLTESLADMVRANNEKISIAKIRSNDFIDSEDCICDFRGSTYQYGEFIIHIYPFYQSTGGTASITLIAE